MKHLILFVVFLFASIAAASEIQRDGFVQSNDLQSSASPSDAQSGGRVRIATATSITVSWIATADRRDDGSLGVVSYYVLKCSKDSITESNFDSSPDVTGEPTPLDSGIEQSMEVTGLQSGTEYFFAIKAVDDSGNLSAISNVPRRKTMRVETSVYAFPNPVRFDAISVVNFYGVPEGKTLLILDSRGALVYMQQNCPDTVQWDGRNQHGEKVKSGTYRWIVPDTPFSGTISLQ